MLADAIPGVSATSIQRITRDVYLYLSRSRVRHRINEIVERDLQSSDRAVVVGHSLGSVVGYYVLRSNPQLQVSAYVMVGSPLGVGPIMRVLRPLRYPTLIGSWFNAVDERDVVSLNSLSPRYFPVEGGKIENYDKVRNRTDNAHGISGYLSDPIVSDTVYHAVTSASQQ